MRKTVLFIMAIIFSGCVSTKTFDGLKSETAALQKQVKKLEGDRDYLIEVLYNQDRATNSLIKALKYLFAKLKKYDSQLFMHSAALETADKDLENLENKMKKLDKKIIRLKEELYWLKAISHPRELK